MDETDVGQLTTLVISILGVISNITILILIFRSNALRTHENYFSIGQSISDLLLSSTILLSFSLTLQNSIPLQSQTTCYLIGFLLNYLAFQALLFAFHIPTSAYRIIVKRTAALTFKQTVIRAGIIVIVSVLVGSIPTILGIEITIQQNQSYCYYDFYSLHPSYNFWNIINSIVFLIPTLIVIYTYYSIWKHLRRTIQLISYNLNFRLQMVVVRRGMLVCIVYFIGYIYPICYSGYKGLTKTSLPVWMDHLSIGLVAFHAFVNPFVYYIAEPRLNVGLGCCRYKKQVRVKVDVIDVDVDGCKNELLNV